jgi:RHS repeat-associated protein
VVVSSGGTVTEVNHYYPFGSVFASSGNMQPYKYNGKELDTKKGLNWYDYGARHYDATLGRWLVVDPLAEKMGSWSPYAYCYSNPLKFVDVDGKYGESIWDISSLLIGVKSFSDNIKSGNIGNAIVDGVGIVFDAVAVALPVVPGGVGAGIKTVRSIDNVVDVITTANKVEETTKAPAKFGSKTDTYSSSRREAFRSAKEQNSIPKSQQPDNIIKPNTPEGVNRGLKDDNVKLYEFTNSKGEKVYIREDKPVKYNDGGSQPPHFNAGNKDDRKLKQHHYYGN